MHVNCTCHWLNFSPRNQILIHYFHKINIEYKGHIEVSYNEEFQKMKPKKVGFGGKKQAIPQKGKGL